MVNKILDASNESIAVTNLLGAGVLEPTKSLQGLPVGTVGDSPTGEVVLKVSIREGGGGGGGGGGAVTIANGADIAQGTTTDAVVGDNTTVTSATAATGISLWKRLVNLGIAILAKLPALGTAGTANANVITVQGIASMTPVLTRESPATATYAPTVLLITTSTTNIPAGALSWSIVNYTSTDLTVDGVAIPAGGSLGGGGYPGKTLDANIPCTLTNGSALIVYDI